MANVNIRVDDAVKQQAETIFSELGLSMSAATSIFYRQVIRTGEIPFELKINKNKELPLDMSKMTQEQIDAEIQKGIDSMNAGRVKTAAEVRKAAEERFERRQTR